MLVKTETHDANEGIKREREREKEREREREREREGWNKLQSYGTHESRLEGGRC